MSVTDHLCNAISSRNGNMLCLALQQILKYQHNIDTQTLNSALKKVSRGLADDKIQFIRSLIKWHNERCSSSPNNDIVVQNAIETYKLWISVIVAEDSCEWTIPALIFACNNMRKAAVAADAQCMIQTDEELAETVASVSPNQDKIIQELRGPVGRMRNNKRAAFIVLFYNTIKVMLALNNFQQAGALVRQVNEILANGIPVGLPKGASVAFSYYIGKILMLSEQFAESEQYLVEALANSHPDAELSRRKIFEILIPVRIRLGRLPSADLLDKYQLDVFNTIVESIKKGNLSLFDKTMNDPNFRAQMLESSTLLTIEKSRMLVYRQLCKLTANYWAEHCAKNKPLGEQSHIVRLGLFEAALKWQMESQMLADGIGDITTDDIIYILANLKQNGLFKGYVALELKKVVLHKSQAFPVPR